MPALNMERVLSLLPLMLMGLFLLPDLLDDVGALPVEFFCDFFDIVFLIFCSSKFLARDEGVTTVADKRDFWFLRWACNPSLSSCSSDVSEDEDDDD